MAAMYPEQTVGATLDEFDAVMEEALSVAVEVTSSELVTLSVAIKLSVAEALDKLALTLAKLALMLDKLALALAAFPNANEE